MPPGASSHRSCAAAQSARASTRASAGPSGRASTQKPPVAANPTVRPAGLLPDLRPPAARARLPGPARPRLLPAGNRDVRKRCPAAALTGPAVCLRPAGQACGRDVVCSTVSCSSAEGGACRRRCAAGCDGATTTPTRSGASSRTCQPRGHGPCASNSTASSAACASVKLPSSADHCRRTPGRAACSTGRRGIIQRARTLPLQPSTSAGEVAGRRSSRTQPSIPAKASLHAACRRVPAAVRRRPRPARWNSAGPR